jgi:hypothetical protein
MDFLIHREKTSEISNRDVSLKYPSKGSQALQRDFLVIVRQAEDPMNLNESPHSINLSERYTSAMHQG